MQAKHFVRIVAGIITSGSAMLALAANPVAAQDQSPRDILLASDVYVERLGTADRVLEPASQLRPGDRVVTIVSWKRTTGANGSVSGFTVTNPLPRTVYYQESAAGNEEVSVDGGRSWGRLGTLRFAGHVATPEDVTHVRWRIATPAPRGRIAYSAIVR